MGGGGGKGGGQGDTKEGEIIISASVRLLA